MLTMCMRHRTKVSNEIRNDSMNGWQCMGYEIYLTKYSTN